MSHIRNKPRLRPHSNGMWYCYRNHYTSLGRYMGRITGCGPTPELAYNDLILVERQIEYRLTQGQGTGRFA